MPRILRILNRFNLGGPTYNAVFLSKFLSPEFETKLIGGMHEKDEAPSEYIARQYGIEAVILPHMRRAIHPWNDRAAYLDIRQIIKDFKPDIVHTHASKAGALGRLAAIHCNVPVIVHTYHGNVLQGYFSNTVSNIFKGIERYLGQHSQALIAISEKQRDELVDIHQIAPSNKVHVIKLGFDLERFQSNQADYRKNFRDKYNIPDKTVTVGIIGRMAPVKQHEVFLKALALAIKSGSPLQAYLIGDGELRNHLENECARLGLGPESVVFTSWISKVEEVLHGLDIVALSSLNEGTPVSLIEASACEIPVVSTRAGGTENVVIHGKTGLLCEVGDALTMSQHLITLANSLETRKKLGIEGRRFVLERFGYNRLVDEMQTLYHQLLISR